jgi:hypothetical protein
LDVCETEEQAVFPCAVFPLGEETCFSGKRRLRSAMTSDQECPPGDDDAKPGRNTTAAKIPLNKMLIARATLTAGSFMLMQTSRIFQLIYLPSMPKMCCRAIMTMGRNKRSDVLPS